MTRAIEIKHHSSKGNQHFKEFIFIGNSANKSEVDLSEQLNLSPDSSFLSQADVEQCCLITQVRTSKDINHQLKDLKIQQGAILKLISKTAHGSVIVSLNRQLVGIGAEIARQIIVKSAQSPT